MAWEVGHPINRDGTNQVQRMPDTLRPERNMIDDRRAADILFFLYRLAEQFRYYGELNEGNGNWQEFFSNLIDGTTPETIRQSLSRIERRSDNPAFLAILLAFLKNFEHLQQDINAHTRNHLEFYYNQVLGFRRQTVTPDKVHVLFELSPHIRQHFLPAGTPLKAGEDATGKPLTYITARDIVVNKARIAALKTTLVTPDDRVLSAGKADSSDGLGAPLNREFPQWPLLGEATSMQPATVGFAIASPLLFLAEGQRKITLTLTLKTPAPPLTANDFKQFSAFGSGANEWIPLPLRALQPGPDKIILVLDIAPDQPPIMAYNSQALDGNFKTRFPVLRLLLNTSGNSYGMLQNLQVQQMELQAEVIASDTVPGVQNLVLQNDQGVLSVGSLMQPFGPTPAKGAQFYIGSREVFSKALSSLVVLLRWGDLPAGSFEEYYAAYPSEYNIDTFSSTLEVLAKGKWLDNPSQKFPLFQKSAISSEKNSDEISTHQSIVIKSGSIAALLLYPDMQDFEFLDPSAPQAQGFIRLKLLHDFGHQVFPVAFAKVAKTADNFDFPNVPYTPVLQSVSLGYVTSVQTIIPNPGEHNGQWFHILPFGSEEVTISTGAPLLPTLPRGAVYIGLSELEPPQNLHLLFRMAEGSATTGDTIIKKEDVEWHYLTDKGWRDTALNGSEIYIDTTLGLQQSGIMAFQIGSDAGTNSTLMPGGMHWLRAMLVGKDRNGNVKKPEDAARAIAIHTQAIDAVFQDNGNDSGHLLQPLPANTITALEKRINAIRKVAQPYASFGGAPAEQDHQFYTRISERLRHKQRAITLWDIERLVLQQFPEIFEVKVLPHTGFDEAGFYTEFLPGHVTVVLVPHLGNPNAVNPLQPRVSVALRESVAQFLEPICAAFITASEDTLHIINPTYEPVLLSFSVGFREGYDSGYYLTVLQDALRRRLSPWAYVEGADIRFGNRVYKSQLLAFVEQQEYVDYVTDFKMLRENIGPGINEMAIEIDLIVRAEPFNSDTDMVQASTAASVLVSAERHLIRTLRPDEYPCTVPDNTCDSGGIECWYIDIDFLVS